MDLEEWELIPDDGFLEIHDDGGKKIFSRKYVRSPKNVFKMDYFRCPSPESGKFVDSSEESRLPKQLIPLPIDQLEYPIVGKSPHDHEEVKEISKIPIVIKEEIKAAPLVIGAPETDQDAVSQVFFKKMKENEFVDMKMDSPKSSIRGITPPPQIETDPFQFEEMKAAEAYKGEAKEGKTNNSSTKVMVEKEMVMRGEEEEEVITWGESNEGLKIWKWSLSGIGALSSFGMAAATICIIILGSGQRNKQHEQNQKLTFQIYSDDKRMKQVVHHATKMNETMAAVRGVPLTRANITHGGYYDGL